PRFSRHIVSMSELRVEVHEVREDESGIDLFELTHHVMHTLVVSCRVNGARHATAGKQILNLANGDHRNAGTLRPIQQRFAGWRQRVVVPVRGALEAADGADERTRDHTADPK